MRVDVFHPRKIPFVYVSPPVCDYIFSASSSTEIFLNTRSPAGAITGFSITFVDGIYRLSWDTYPGALCYTVYKLVDELDPFSNYVAVVECVTDNFYDTTDPGAYQVVPITPEGEEPIPETPAVPTPPGGCTSVPPNLTGTSEYVCPGESVNIDLAGLVSGGTPPFSYGASTDTGSATVDGSTLTYTAPAGLSIPVTVNVVVTDACGETYLTAVNIIPYEEGVLTVPTDPIEACREEPLVVDIADYISTPAEQDQEFQVQSANIFDQGGSVVFGEGSTVTYTPSSVSGGDGTLRICATDQCGNEFCGDFPILVKCADCTDAMADVTTGVITGGASGAWSAGYGSASISAVAVPFSGTITSTQWTETVVSGCVARIVLTGGGGPIFASVNVSGSNIWSGNVSGTYLVPFSTQIGLNSASITVANNLGASCTCTVELNPV